MEQGEKAVPKRECVMEPSTEQLKQAKAKAAEELYAILFLNMDNLQKYGKIIKDLENAVLQKKDAFPNNVSDACILLNGWRNNANDGVTFAKTRKNLKRPEKRKELMCFGCKKVRRYASECE